MHYCDYKLFCRELAAEAEPFKMVLSNTVGISRHPVAVRHVAKDVQQ